VGSAFEQTYTADCALRAVAVMVARIRNENQANDSPKVSPAYNLVWEPHFCRTLGCPGWYQPKLPRFRTNLAFASL